MKKINPRIRVTQGLEAGAYGFVLKQSAPEELSMAVRAALERRRFITPILAGEVLDAMRLGPAKVTDQAASLTLRQREVLRLIAEGFSAKEIAKTLDISQRTVEYHKYCMMETLGAKSSSDLIHFAIKHGIVES